MKLVRNLSLAVLAAFGAATANAAPSVSGVTGTPSTGQTIRITGAGFNTKSPAAPYLWADFESGMNPTSLGQQTSWAKVQSMAWSAGEGYKGTGAAKATDSAGFWTLRTDYSYWSRENQRSYMYKRTKHNFLITNTSQNWKIWRCWAESGKPNIYFASNNGRAFVEYINASVDSGFWANFNSNSTNWISEEILFKASSGINVKDGSLTYRIDGQDKASGSVMTRSSAAPDYMTQNYVLHSVLANSSLWSPAWSSNNRVWVDNIYVDTTWARVILGNASTYSSCTIVDPQVPTAWADGTISVVANTVSFGSGARAYIYVVDKDGNVNSNGYAVTIGQGGSVSNQAPSVSAGADLTATVGTTLQLTGTATDDGLPSGSSLATAWTLVSGPLGSVIVNVASKITGITFALPGTYVYRLTASDGSLSASDDVSVTANAVQPVNLAPTVSAGNNSTVTIGTNASLTGTASDDGLPSTPGAVTTTWTKVSGPTGATIQSASSRNTSVSFTTAGTYVFRLTATDGALSATDDVQVTVNAPAAVNAAPSVNAGSNATVTLGSNVSLSAAVTDDGLPSSQLTYAWTKVSGPNGAVLLTPSSRTSAVSFTTVGTYVFRHTADDGALSAADDVQVTVQAPPNAAPTASAGGDIVVMLGNDAALSGTANDDGLPASPGALSTTWSKVSGPSGVTISNASSRNTTASFTTAGTYVFRLSVTDGALSDTDDVQVTVQAPSSANLAPAVNAGADVSTQAGQTVSLEGRVTDDGLPNPPSLTTVAWSLVSGPGTPTIAEPGALSTAVTFPTAGQYVLRLTADDGAIQSADTLTVSVQAVSTTNFAPTASAGPDQVVQLPAQANLSASGTDDGLPTTQLTYAWGKVSGPGTVSFGDVSAPATSASFSTPGLYVLAVTLNDGELKGTDELSIDVRTAIVAGSGPTVLGVSGRLTSGQQMQVVGSNFGEKSPAAPLVYADFETSVNPSSLGQVRSWSGIENLQWSNNGFNGTKGVKAADGNGVWTLRVDRDDWSNDAQRSYVFRRQRMNFLVTDQSQNWKTWRLWAANFGYPNIYAATNNGRVYVENIGSESGFWGNFRQKTTNWSTEEILTQASGADQKNGLLVMRYDGVEQARGSVMTRSAVSPSKMAMNFVVHGVVANKPAWSPAWNTNNRIWVDDVYVDNTWARVMIGDAPTYAACRKFDIQIPARWSSGAVTFYARTTSFAKKDRAYVYVFDPNGEVNATGFPVTVDAQHFGSLVDGGEIPGNTGDETQRNVFNPVRGEHASLSYALRERGSVKVVIYDRGGRRVKELVGDEVLEGAHTIRWDGRNDDGSLVASGVYIAVSKGSEGSRNRHKVAVIK